MKDRKYRSGGIFFRVAVFAVLGVLLLSYFAKDSNANERKREALYSATELGAGGLEKADSPVVRTWKYSQSVDKMSGDIIYFATLDSRNLIKLKYPYHGHNQPQLTIRKSIKGGYEVMFSISQGQILCRNCDVSVRFDDLPTMKFKGVRSASHETEILFLMPGKKFVDAMKKAQTVKIEVLIYKEGGVVSTFDTGGFVDAIKKE